MTDAQIRQIMERLEQQDEVFRQHIEDQKKLDEERLAANWRVYETLQKSNKDFHDDNQAIHGKIDSLTKDVEPIITLSKNIQGSGKLAVISLKIVLGIAAFITASGTILYVIRKLILGSHE